MEGSEPKDHLFGLENGHTHPRASGLKKMGEVDLKWVKRIWDVGDEGFNAKG